LALAACGALDAQLATTPAPKSSRPDQAAVSTAVAWSFIQLMVPDVVKADAFPALHAYAHALEQTPLFQRYPMV
jgi:hypothetical protein